MGKRYFKVERIRDIKILLERAAKLYQEKIAFKELGLGKKILEYSYRRLEEDVNALGTKLLDMGMKGYHAAILGENSYTWVVSYLSVVNGLGVAVPLDKELTDEDIAKLIKKSDTDMIICSDTFVPVIKNILSECPDIKACIVMNSRQEYPDFFDLNKLIAEGKELMKNGKRDYLDAFIDVDSMCEIVFTSGTTGPNKGVMLSHKNIMAVVYGAFSLIKAGGQSFSVLPMNHTYEFSCHILGGIYIGICICINDSLKRVTDNMKLFKPDMSIMVPLFLEAMHKNIWKRAEKDGLAGHLRYGIRYSNILRKIGIDCRRIFFRPILESLGGNLSQIVCGGAPLRSEIIKGLDDIGINILNGYGITECGPLVATNSVLGKRAESVGHVMAGCKVRIYDPDNKGFGEIQVIGDNVMLGYYKDPESTRISFTEDGWLRTGDLGYMDKNDFLYVSGREKNLIILENGKNVHPEELEEIVLEKLPYVKEAVVYASGREEGSAECINVCVYIDEEYIEVNRHSDIKQRLDCDIDLVNRNLPVYKRITNTFIRDSEFEKTTTKKIKRG